MKISTILGGEPVLLSVSGTAGDDGLFLYTLSHELSGASFDFKGAASADADALLQMGCAAVLDAKNGMSTSLEDYAALTGLDISKSAGRTVAQAAWEASQQVYQLGLLLSLDPVDGICATAYAVVEA